MVSLSLASQTSRSSEHLQSRQSTAGSQETGDGHLTAIAGVNLSPTHNDKEHLVALLWRLWGTIVHTEAVAGNFLVRSYCLVG